VDHKIAATDVHDALIIPIMSEQRLAKAEKTRARLTIIFEHNGFGHSREHPIKTRSDAITTTHVVFAVIALHLTGPIDAFNHAARLSAQRGILRSAGTIGNDEQLRRPRLPNALEHPHREVGAAEYQKCYGSVHGNGDKSQQKDEFWSFSAQENTSAFFPRGAYIYCPQPMNRNNSGVRALLWPGTYDCKNLGDVAMLQVAVERLSRAVPGSVIRVLTQEPEELRRFCPSAMPVSLRGWDRVREARILPRWAPRRNGDYPRPPGALSLRFWRAKAALLRGKYAAGRGFLREFEDTDVVFLAGCGLINDHFVRLSLSVLALLEMALNRGLPVALFSQGIGPMENPTLRKRAAEILPRVRSLFIRDNATTPALLDRLGVTPEKITFTGDDAVALAWHNRSDRIGAELGFNLRIAPYSGLTEQTFAEVRQVLIAKATQDGVSLVGVPIARGNRECDMVTAQQMLDGAKVPGDAGTHADTPLKAIAQVARCRLVVSGSYHGAVFALAQGIPAVCIAGNLYYANKFLGLAHAFGEGCTVLRADDNSFNEALPKAIAESWNKADPLRPVLLQEAERQVRSAEKAYAALLEELRPESAGRVTSQAIASPA
jgi:polysaccharide pyruvyl transferase WcaK-like protein